MNFQSKRELYFVHWKVSFRKCFIISRHKDSKQKYELRMGTLRQYLCWSFSCAKFVNSVEKFYLNFNHLGVHLFLTHSTYAHLNLCAALLEIFTSVLQIRNTARFLPHRVFQHPLQGWRCMVFSFSRCVGNFQEWEEVTASQRATRVSQSLHCDLHCPTELIPGWGTLWEWAPFSFSLTACVFLFLPHCSCSLLRFVISMEIPIECLSGFIWGGSRCRSERPWMWWLQT